MRLVRGVRWAVHDLIERDGRRWFEVIHHEMLERVPLFQGGDALLLNQIGMALQTCAVAAGETIVREGDRGDEMFVIGCGEVEILDSVGAVVDTMHEGDFFGELALLCGRSPSHRPSKNALRSIRARPSRFHAHPPRSSTLRRYD